MRDSDTVRTLRLEIQELQHACTALQEQLASARERAELAQRSAAEAWSFAKLAFRGRGVTPALPRG